MSIRLRKLLLIIIPIIIIAITSFVLYYSIPQSRSFFLKPIDRFNTDCKVVALTFDDGPSPQWTPRLLDILKKYDVNASFFLVGEKMISHLDIAKRIQREGHFIGEHTFNHNRMIFKSSGFIKHDLEKMDNLFNSTGIGNTGYFRPPYGVKLLVLPYILKKQHKSMVTWDVEPKAQYEREFFNPKKISAYILSNTRPGSIILLHDGWSGDPSLFLKAVEDTIIGLRKHGYSFITIEEGIKLNKKN